MATDATEIQLDESQRAMLAKLSEQTGRPWGEILGDALASAADRQSVSHPKQRAFDAAAKPIWRAFDAVLKLIPPAELAALPSDTAEEHDHYVYGTPKRKP